MNKNFIFTLGILLGILLSIVFDYIINKNNKIEFFNVEKELKQQIKSDSIKIDSLKKDIIVLKNLNDSLSKKEVIIDSIFIKKIDQIKTLPIDSSVYLLKTNIEKYEKRYY